MFAKLSAEFLGTFWLVLGGCGSAVLAAGFPDVGIGLVGVSFAFGLTVLTARLFARPDLRRPLQSGGLGRPVGRRPLPGRAGWPVHRRAGAGGIAGAGVLYLIASGNADFSLAGGFASTATASTHPAAIR